MIGSRQMERVLSAAQAAGAKVVLVGDPEQLQAIEAGAAFRALAERHGAAEITDGTPAARGLAARRHAGAGHGAHGGGAGAVCGGGDGAGGRHARARRVRGWWRAGMRRGRQRPEESQVILAYTRDDVRDLNELARAELRAAGELQGADQVVQTERGERAFAAGDRIMFQRNERGLGGDGRGRGGVAVKNGTLGTVLEVASGGERLTVRLDGPAGRRGRLARR